jgi:hypothetical protein
MPGVYEALIVAPFNRVRKTSKIVSDTFALRLAKKNMSACTDFAQNRFSLSAVGNGAVSLAYARRYPPID